MNAPVNRQHQHQPPLSFQHGFTPASGPGHGRVQDCGPTRGPGGPGHCGGLTARPDNSVGGQAVQTGNGTTIQKTGDREATITDARHYRLEVGGDPHATLYNAQGEVIGRFDFQQHPVTVQMAGATIELIPTKNPTGGPTVLDRINVAYGPQGMGITGFGGNGPITTMPMRAERVVSEAQRNTIKLSGPDLAHLRDVHGRPVQELHGNIDSLSTAGGGRRGGPRGQFAWWRFENWNWNSWRA
jgi:hypothetical protein